MNRCEKPGAFLHQLQVLLRSVTSYFLETPREGAAFRGFPAAALSARLPQQARECRGALEFASEDEQAIPHQDGNS